MAARTAQVSEKIVEKLVERIVVMREREKMPDRRKGYTQKAVVGGHKVYLRTGEYDDAGSARSSSTCTRRAPRCAPSSTILRSRSRSVCNTACRWKSMSTPSPSPASSRRGPVQGNDSIKYATSILDYVFRELAVSYMSRFDLAHVDPTESNFDALGRGVEEGKDPESQNHQATKYLSKGLTRSRTDNLVVMRGGSTAVTGNSDSAPAGGSRVTSLASHGAPAAAASRPSRRGRAEAGSQPRPLRRGQRCDAAAAGRRRVGVAGHSRGAAAHDDEVVGARAGQALRQVLCRLVVLALRVLAFLDAPAERVEIALGGSTWARSKRLM